MGTGYNPPWFEGSKRSGDGALENYMLNTIARNLVPSQEVSKGLLEYCFSLMTIKERSGFVDWVNGPVKAEGQDKSYRLMDNGDVEELAEGVIRGLARKKCVVSNKDIKHRLLRLFERRVTRLRKSASSRAFKKLSELQRVFGLDEDEMGIVGLLYCYEQCRSLEKMVDEYKLNGVIKLIALALETTSVRIRKRLSLNGRLARSSILDKIDPTGNQIFKLNEEIVGYLSGLDSVPFADKYCKEHKGDTHDLESFRVSETSVSMMRELLVSDKPCHILLHGMAGTGKTEFVKALAGSIGKSAFFTQYGEGSMGTPVHPQQGRKMALTASTACVPKDAILVVDEADCVLNTGYFMFGSNYSPEKGWLNSFLDDTKHQVIWITNDTGFIEESTLRRFAYSIKFKKFTKRDREEIWKQILKTHPMRRFISEKMVREMSTDYQVNAAGIASALDTLKNVIPRKGADKAKVKASLTELLQRHQEVTGHNRKTSLNVLTDRYDVSALNIDTDRNGFIKSVETYAEHRKETGGLADGNINLLFWGQPGTGKTEFAKYLADLVGMDLLVKRASDLLNPYVGGTEANIRDAFEEAERGESILFIDEADSLFINRETATRSWESSQTNELLTQMENHKGIVICCTNMLDHLDRAVMRRFAWKVEFKPLKGEGKVKLYKEYFPLKARISEPQKRKLETIPDLTPGDIKAIWQKYRFVGLDNLDHASLINDLAEEVQYRKGTVEDIGFTDFGGDGQETRDKKQDTRREEVAREMGSLEVGQRRLKR